jgi:hypothetical protein
MKKIKTYSGYLGCRTTGNIEWMIKSICAANNRSVSEVINYLCRLFIEDANDIRTKFLGPDHEKPTEKP